MGYLMEHDEAECVYRGAYDDMALGVGLGGSFQTMGCAMGLQCTPLAYTKRSAVLTHTPRYDP